MLLVFHMMLQLHGCRRHSRQCDADGGVNAQRRWRNGKQPHERTGCGDGGSGRTLLISGQDILNQGGTIRGGDILVAAARDVRNESLASRQTYSSANTSGSYTVMSNQASIVASGTLEVHAGRDITNVAGRISAANASLTAARDVNFNALATGSTYTAQVGQDAQNNLTVGHALTQVNTTGDLVVSAGRDLTLKGAQLAIGGDGALLAGRALTVASVVDQIRTDEHGDAAANPSQAGGVNVSVSMGVSKSDSKTVQTSTTAVGSVVLAGGNVSIHATGAGKESDVIVQVSTVKAGGNVTLKADDEIKLLAGKNTAEQHSTNNSSSASVGVSVGTSGLLYTVSASGARGSADGSDVSWTNTRVDAGNTLTLQSDGDTTLKGTVATGTKVVVLVGGDLDIESLQDTSVYDSKQKSLGASVSVGAGVVGGSVNVSNSKMQSDFASVKEQSGIKAGDGGFQLTVGRNTNLVGAAITSTDAAMAAGKNALSTSTLTQSDLQNKANYAAQSVSLGGGYSTGGAGVGKDQQGNAVTGGAQTPGSTLPSLNGFTATAPVAMTASGNASSVTQSGISGGAVHHRHGGGAAEQRGGGRCPRIGECHARATAVG